MSYVARTLRVQRRILAATLVLSALLFWRAAFTVFSLPKATVVLLGVIAMAATAAVRVARTRRALLPSGPPVWAAGAFVGAMALATVFASNRWQSLVGQDVRYTGLVMYAAYVAVFLFAARLYRDHSPGHLAKALLVAATPITLYGFFQLAGRDFIRWGFEEYGPPMFGTLGNPNFFAGWVGIVGVLGIGAALSSSLSPAWRWFCAAQGVTCGAAAAVSQSLNGAAAFAVGVGVVTVAGVAGWQRAGRWRWVGLGGGLGLAGSGVVLLAAGVGPLGTVREMVANSYRSRVGRWEAAWAMFTDRPVLGWGMDGFTEQYWAYRSLEEVARYGLSRAIDSTHNLALAMLTGGGLALGLAWLAVVVTVAWSLVVGLRRLEGGDRALLAAFGAGWAAYLTQAMVSMDMPHLAVLGWALAGVVVAVAGTAPLREVVLPGAPSVVTPAPGRRGKRRRQRREDPLVDLPGPVGAGIGVGTAVLVVLALVPLTADRIAGGARLAEGRDPRTAVAGYEAATWLAPWDARYPSRWARVLVRLGQHDEALDAHEVVWRRERTVFRALAAAQGFGRRDADRAAVWFDRAAAIDPRTPEVLDAAGRFFVEYGQPSRAADIYRHALDLYPEDDAWWVALGEALAAAGDTDGARAAFERALDLNPDADGAAERLRELG